MISEEIYKQLTPMMRQYVDTKREYEDCLLFYRLGDFYELFFDDALTASRELEITLTQRAAGLEDKIPMAGVPYHVADQYISRLIRRGYKVAICDQVEDPKEAKGLVRREVTRVVTPGTFTDTDYLDEKSQNYLMGIYTSDNTISLCICDYLTGEMLVTEELAFEEKEGLDFLRREITSFNPSECLLYKDDVRFNELNKLIATKLDYRVSVLTEDSLSDSILDEIDFTEEIEALEDENKLNHREAILLVLNYLHETQMNSLQHLQKLNYYSSRNYLVMNDQTKLNLELIESIQAGQKKNTLLSLLDGAITAMGSRELKRWINQPLVNLKQIQFRQNIIGAFHEDLMTMDAIKESLRKVYDFDRLSVKISQKSLTPKEMVQLKLSLEAIKEIKDLLDYSLEKPLKEYAENIDPLDNLRAEIDQRIIDDPPVAFAEERFIKPGFDRELDQLFEQSEGGVQWLLDLEAKERQRTGIKNLKVKFNKILGYFIEVTKSNLDAVPEDYIRKQTLVGSERYFTVELKEREASILHSKDEALLRQLEILSETRAHILKSLKQIQNLAHQISQLDCLLGLSDVARLRGYVRPEFNNNGTISITAGRHPMVEARLEEEEFVPNDALLDSQEHLIQIITGPNMAGKSTYMRQVALIIIMAQIGSYIPAKSANLSIVDQIFTRIGASDNVSQGQSTFMVEMMEVAHIVNHATKDSLILLDEVGRGTSTFDGLSIAWALVEYLVEHIPAKTLFATHYHELTKLAEDHDKINNLTIATEKTEDGIIFLRKIIPGFTNHSFGIEVARLAGVLEPIIERAYEILNRLEMEDQSEMIDSLSHSMPVREVVEMPKEVKETIDAIKAVDINRMTPLEALKFIDELKWNLEKDR